MRFTTAVFLAHFWTQVYEIYYSGIFGSFLDPCMYVRSRKGVICPSVENGFARFARSTIMT